MFTRRINKKSKPQFRPSLEHLEDRHALAINHAPLLTNPGPRISNEGAVVKLQVHASDADHNALTYRATHLPGGLSINAKTGLITGTVGNQAARKTPYAVTLFVSDGKATTQKSFNWTIKDITTPTLKAQPDKTSLEGNNVSVIIVGKDADGDKLAFAATGLPMGLAINRTTGVISGTIGPKAGLSSPYSVTVSASDGFRVGKTSFLWTVTDGTVPIFATIPAKSSAEGETVNLQVLATDADNDPLTFSAVGLPGGLSIDSATGVISGMIGNQAASETPYGVTIFAHDGTTTSSTNFDWTITDGTLPVFGEILPQTDSEGSVVNLQVPVTDADNDPVSYFATGLPAGLSIDLHTGVISGIVGDQAASNTAYTVNLVANDGQGNQTYSSFLWTITDDTTPDLGTLSDQTNMQGTNVSLQMTAIDPDGDASTFSADNLPPGLSIDSTTGLITGFLGNDSVGVYAVTIHATDGFNTGELQFQWTITAFQSPGDSYDVNNDVTDGAELTDTDLAGHTQAAAYYLGAHSGADSDGGSFTGHIYSDSRVHANPAVTGFDSTTGSAPDFYKLDATGGFAVVNDYSVTISMNGGSANSLYKLTFTTDKGTFITTVAGNGSATISGGSGSYSDNTQITFKIEKVSGISIQEAVTYSVVYHL